MRTAQGAMMERFARLPHRRDRRTRAGVSVETTPGTTRSVALLNAAPGARSGGFRDVLGTAVVHQVRFIKQAQSLGLTLDDIRQLVGRPAAHEATRRPCRKVSRCCSPGASTTSTHASGSSAGLPPHAACRTSPPATSALIVGVPDPPCPTIDALDGAHAREPTPMKHGEKVAPVMAAAITGLATLVVLLCRWDSGSRGGHGQPAPPAVAAYQPWFLGVSGVCLWSSGCRPAAPAAAGMRENALRTASLIVFSLLRGDRCSSSCCFHRSSPGCSPTGCRSVP